jgi:ADP-heptose:LPS heptosyltransferase
MKLKYKLALAYVNAIKWFRSITIDVFVKLLFKKTTAPKKILINRDGAFGDSVVAMPAIAIIRQNHPDAQIDLLSVNNNGISFKDIGVERGLINNLYNINKKERKDTLKNLKEETYDLFVQIPQNIGIYKSIRNMLLVRFYLNIKHAFGWDRGRIKSFMRLQKQYTTISTDTVRFLDTLRQNGFVGEIRYPLKSLAPKDHQIYKLIQETQPVAFLIGGKLQPKKWPLNHWKSLAKLIGSEQNILIIGGNTEMDDGEEIKSDSSNIFNLCNRLTVPELRYVLEKTKIAISLDTGAMHLCDTTNTKLIALFSTRDLSNKWFPNNKDSIVIEKLVHCSFCLKTKCLDNICMSNILPNEVYSEMNKLLLK